MKLFKDHAGKYIARNPVDEYWSAHRVGEGKWEWWSHNNSHPVSPVEAVDLEGQYQDLMRQVPYGE